MEKDNLEDKRTRQKGAQIRKYARLFDSRP
jgi:hypothetical protein